MIIPTYETDTPQAVYTVVKADKEQVIINLINQEND